MEVRHADCPNAYLNGKASKLALVKLPKYWNAINGDQLGKDGDPVIMRNSLYGTPDAGRNWNHVINEFLIGLGFIRAHSEPCFYSMRKGKSFIHVVLWVDDIFYTSNKDTFYSSFESSMVKRFSAKLLGKLNFALGLHFKWTSNGCTVNQSKYIEKIVQKFGLKKDFRTNTPITLETKLTRKCRGEDMTVVAENKVDGSFPYRQIIGSLMYLAVNTRPDITFVTGLLVRFSNFVQQPHIEAVQHLLRYIKTTKDVGMFFPFGDGKIHI